VLALGGDPTVPVAPARIQALRVVVIVCAAVIEEMQPLALPMLKNHTISKKDLPVELVR
jgi:hypothetical protein